MTTQHVGQARMGLADVLGALGEELRLAAERGGETLAWMNAEVQMEVAVETSASGGVKFWVLNGDAAGKRITTTKVTVSVAPHAAFEQPLGVGK